MNKFAGPASAGIFRKCLGSAPTGIFRLRTLPAEADPKHLLVLLSLSFLLTSCRGASSVLAPRGVQADRIAQLWWVLLIVCTVIFIIVMGLVSAAVLRHRRAATSAELSPRARRNLVVIGGVFLPSVILFALIAYSSWVGEKISAAPSHLPLTIEVVGHQFWWEVNYLDGERFTTANEIHLPAGVPVRFLLKTNDVIHSFWAPNLHGKTDQIPGQTNTMWLKAEAPGVYRGVCAEFCGVQHALMAFVVVVETPEQFAAWQARQRQPAAADAAFAQGRAVFLHSSCVLCHAIRGASEDGGARAGPELTHFGSRRTIGAGARPNTHAQLRAFISNPHAIKPGVRMPPAHLDAARSEALVNYLMSLQ